MLLTNPVYKAQLIARSKRLPLSLEEKFTTKLLTERQKLAFLRMLKTTTKDTGLFKKIEKSAWQLSATSDSDGTEHLVSIVRGRRTLTSSSLDWLLVVFDVVGEQRAEESSICGCDNWQERR